MDKQLEQEVKLLKLKELKREREQEKKRVNEEAGISFAFLVISSFLWIVLVIGWTCELSYILFFIFISAINLLSIFTFRYEWRKQNKVIKQIKELETKIKELENPSRKLSDMSSNEQLIYYIKTREEWKDQKEAKSKAVSWIISGVKNISIFATYWITENHFLQKEIEQIYQQNPNYRYVVDTFTLTAFWGFGSFIFGIISYLISKRKAKQLKRKVRQLERELRRVKSLKG